MQQHNKTAKKQSHPVFKGCIRHASSLCCAQGAFGRYLVAGYTGKRLSVPDPRKQDWNGAFMWPGRHTGEPMPYSTRHKSSSNLLQMLGLVLGKSKHAPRYCPECDDKSSEEVSETSLPTAWLVACMGSRTGTKP